MDPHGTDTPGTIIALVIIVQAMCLNIQAMYQQKCNNNRHIANQFKRESQPSSVNGTSR